MGDPVFYQATDDQPITSPVTEHILNDGGQLLVAFGPDGGRLSPTDEQAVRAALSDVLPLGTAIQAVAGHDWRADEFSKGTWSVFRPGQLTGSLPALQAPHGRVVFACADIADGWNGFLDGAIESGAGCCPLRVPTAREPGPTKGPWADARWSRPLAASGIALSMGRWKRYIAALGNRNYGQACQREGGLLRTLATLVLGDLTPGRSYTRFARLSLSGRQGDVCPRCAPAV
jgi:hypothetical protein